jgi:hypothetical protein
LQRGHEPHVFHAPQIWRAKDCAGFVTQPFFKNRRGRLGTNLFHFIHVDFVILWFSSFRWKKTLFSRYKTFPGKGGPPRTKPRLGVVFARWHGAATRMRLLYFADCGGRSA